MKLSARNMLKGRIKKLARGTVNLEVTLELPGGMEIVSVITLASGDSLGLEVGRQAYAVVKASNVMIAVD